MIVSTDHNFIFVHIPKTGGSSMRRILAAYHCGAPRRGPKQVAAALAPFPQPPRRLYFRPHARASWARWKLGRDFFDSTFSFAVVRNPYDRAVSRYAFLQQSKNPRHIRHYRGMSFADFIEEEVFRARFRGLTQMSRIADRKGRILVTRVYRQESLDDAIPEICATIGIAPPAQMPRSNVSTRRSDYRSYFTRSLRNRFETAFAVDIEAFGYTF